ncbi:transposable element tc3 transposase [Apiospora phragmitis]|uniref:Transposable element tc3 transposase n=1 Tax=Apiospora phragmitis TaxID=2905665 RepID=A0ABR1UZQ1_9PEZI
MTRPKGIHTKALTQKDHDRINILYRDALRTRKEIEAITGFTESQIKRALATKLVSRGTGRPPKLTKAQEDELVAYVTANKEQQAMSYLELSHVLFGHSFGEYAIRSTLRRRGFCRYNGKTRPELPGKVGGQQQRVRLSGSSASSSSATSARSLGTREEEQILSRRVSEHDDDDAGNRASRALGVASICE